MLEVHNKTRTKIDLILVKKFGNFFLNKFSISSFDVSIVFVGDDKITKINKKYLGHDYVTDVIAFPGEDNFLGEIIICLPQVYRQAGEYNNSKKDELLIVVCHGLLHLIGFTDEGKRKKEIMLNVGDGIIEEYKKYD